MSEYKDYIVRATAADHQLRAFAVTSKDIVEKAREIHNTSPVATAAIGRLLTAASMMGTHTSDRMWWSYRRHNCYG